MRKSTTLGLSMLLMVIFSPNLIKAQQPDGTLDTSYHPFSAYRGTAYPDGGNKIALQQDGKTIHAGAWSGEPGMTKKWLLRINTDGSIDKQFDVNIPSFSGGTRATGAAIQMDGADEKIIVSTNAELFRLNPDGTKDNSFTPALTTNIWGLAIQPTDQKILLFIGSNGTNTLVRLNIDGTKDAGFAPNFNNRVYVALPQKDGKILVGGNFTTVNGSTTGSLIRLNEDGTLDPTFDVSKGGLKVNNWIINLTRQDDGKYLVAGQGFQSYNGTTWSKGGFIRINADGSLDEDFNKAGAGLAGGYSNGGMGVAPQSTFGSLALPNGKIILIGSFETYNGVASRNIARLNEDGSLDPSFEVGQGFTTNTGTTAALSRTPHQIILELDTSIIVSGTFSGYDNATPAFNIVRLKNTVKSAPTVAPITIKSLDPPPSYCLNSKVSITYDATGTYNTGNKFTAQLSDANGSFASPTAIGSVTATASGTIDAVIPTTATAGSKYRIRVVSSNPALTGDDNGTDFSITSGVDMTKFIIKTSPDPAVVCKGDEVTLSGAYNGTGILPQMIYTWDNGVTDNKAFTADATKTYTMTAKVAGGCTATKQMTVTVNPLPDVTATAKPDEVCAGDETTLNGGGAKTYTWDNGATDDKSFEPKATQTYTVTGKDANGCSNTAKVTVTVNQLPDVTATAKPDAVCAGDETTLAGGGAKTYTWDNGVTDSKSFAPKSTQTYTVTGKDANGCMNTASVKVTVNPLPNVTATANPGNIICVSNSVTLNGGGASTYTWNNGVADNVAFTPDSSRTYTVTGKDANGCIGTADITVTLKDTAVVMIADSICSGDTYTLGTQTLDKTGNYTEVFVAANGCDSTVMLDLTVNQVDLSITQNGNGLSAMAGASYQWINCKDNTPISGATSQTYSSDVTGDFAVIVTMGDCSDTSTCYHIEGVGIHENDFKQSITLYPNPNHGSMTVTAGYQLNNATVRIVNVVGQTVMEKSKLSGNRFAFDVQNYAAGVYYLEISEGTKVARIKFVKD